MENENIKKKASKGINAKYRKKNILFIGFSDLAFSLVKNLLIFNNDVLKPEENDKGQFLFNIFVLNKENGESDKERYGESRNNKLKEESELGFKWTKNLKATYHFINDFDCSNSEKMKSLSKTKEFKDIKKIDVVIISVGDKISTILSVTHATSEIKDIKIGRIYVRIDEEQYFDVINRDKITGNKLNKFTFFNVEKHVAETEAIELVSDSILSFIHIDTRDWSHSFSYEESEKKGFRYPSIKKEDRVGVATIELAKNMSSQNLLRKLKHATSCVLFGYSNEKDDEKILPFPKQDKELCAHTHIFVYGKFSHIYHFDNEINKMPLKRFIIIGIRGFGKLLAENIESLGSKRYKELIVIDRNKNEIEKLNSKGIQNARILDASDLENLENIGLSKMKNAHAIICIEKDDEMRMRTVLNLQHLNFEDKFIKVKLPSNRKVEHDVYDEILNVQKIVTNDLAAKHLISHVINSDVLKYYSSLDSNNKLNFKEYGIAKFQIRSKEQLTKLTDSNSGLHLIADTFDNKNKKASTNVKSFAIVWGHLNTIIYCARQLEEENK